MPNKVLKRVSLNLLSVGLSIVLLSGCSTIGDGMDSAGSAVVSLTEATAQSISDINVEKLGDKKYSLVQSFDEPVRSLDSWAMRIESREVCPEGYVYLNRKAVKSSLFASSDNECVASGSCHYELQWQIRCEAIPEEPFSFFGKT